MKILRMCWWSQYFSAIVLNEFTLQHFVYRMLFWLIRIGGILSTMIMERDLTIWSKRTIWRNMSITVIEVWSKWVMNTFQLGDKDFPIIDILLQYIVWCFNEWSSFLMFSTRQCTVPAVLEKWQGRQLERDIVWKCDKCMCDDIVKCGQSNARYCSIETSSCSIVKLEFIDSEWLYFLWIGKECLILHFPPFF